MKELLRLEKFNGDCDFKIRYVGLGIFKSRTSLLFDEAFRTEQQMSFIIDDRSINTSPDRALLYLFNEGEYKGIVTASILVEVSSPASGALFSYLFKVHTHSAFKGQTIEAWQNTGSAKGTASISRSSAGYKGLSSGL